MKLTTFSKSRIKFDKSSVIPTKGDNRLISVVVFFMGHRVLSQMSPHPVSILRKAPIA